jgi:hypothetical protein
VPYVQAECTVLQLLADVDGWMRVCVVIFDRVIYEDAGKAAKEWFRNTTSITC